MLLILSTFLIKNSVPIAQEGIPTQKHQNNFGPICSLAQGSVIYQNSILMCNNEPLFFDLEFNLTITVVGDLTETSNIISFTGGENLTFYIQIENININSNCTYGIIIDKGFLVLSFKGNNRIKTIKSDEYTSITSHDKEVLYGICCLNGGCAQIKSSDYHLHSLMIDTYLSSNEKFGDYVFEKAVLLVTKEKAQSSEELNMINGDTTQKKKPKINSIPRAKTVGSLTPRDNTYDREFDCSINNNHVKIDTIGKKMRCGGNIEDNLVVDRGLKYKLKVTMSNPDSTNNFYIGLFLQYPEDHVDLFLSNINLKTPNNNAPNAYYDSPLTVHGNGIAHIYYKDKVRLDGRSNTKNMPAVYCSGNVEIHFHRDPSAIGDTIFDIQGGDGYPGIGPSNMIAGRSDWCKSVFFHDGYYKIEPGNGAAGIGGNQGFSENKGYIELVQIEGGKFDFVDLIGAATGAAIGGGKGEKKNSSFVKAIIINNITINSLTAGPGGAAIGGGSGDAEGSSYVESITINNGYFKMNSVGNGAVIGGGNGGFTGSSFVNSITITNGTFELGSSSNGAVIGAGLGHSESSSNIGIINITGGKFTITNFKYGAGIGGGRGGILNESPYSKYSANVNQIEISGGIFISNDNIGIYASFIGSGCGEYSHTSNIGSISIKGGFFSFINQSPEKYSALLGGGNGIQQNSSNVKQIIIEDGHLELKNTGSKLFGALIGGGCGNKGDDSSAINLINISGGDILGISNFAENTTAAGIGGGYGSKRGVGNVDVIEIGSLKNILKVNVSGGKNGAGIGAGLGGVSNSGSVNKLILRDLAHDDDLIVAYSMINPIGSSKGNGVLRNIEKSSGYCFENSTTTINGITVNMTKYKNGRCEKHSLTFSNLEEDEDKELITMAYLFAMQNFAMYS